MTLTASQDKLSSKMRGELIAPEHADYDEVRKVWNGMIDEYPALIARCEGTSDVIAALDYARTEGLPATIRGGGHSVAGRAVRDDALLIDMSLMRSVQVDPTTRTARVESGATLGDLDHETQAFGLAMTGGVDSRTGVAGLTLGGGIGHLGRRFGLTIDHLVSAEVVLPDGRVVTASEHSHPDLFWALRGGGHGLGVVTSFEFKLHEVGPEVATSQCFYSMDKAAAALRGYRAFHEEYSDTGAFALFVNVPPVEGFPEELHGETCLAIVGMTAIPLPDGESIMEDLGAIGDPFLRIVAPMPYTALQSAFDAGAPDGGRYYWKAGYLDGLTDELIDLLVSTIDRLPGAFSNVFIEPLGGAIAEVTPDATAFPHRSSAFGYGISSGWEDASNDDASIQWTRGLHDQIQEHANGGVYINYVDRDEQRTVAAYQANASRLDGIRSVYDPEGVLRAGWR